MQQRIIVKKLNSLNQHRQFMAFKSCEVITLEYQRRQIIDFFHRASERGEIKSREGAVLNVNRFSYMK